MDFAVMKGKYLVHDILQRVGAVNREADKEEICLWI
jgi:hypothetical protein